jgi:hypothetical protein
VTLVDIDLGGESGFDLVERLAPAPTVLMSLHSEADFTELIEASSALGFLPKSRLSAAAMLRPGLWSVGSSPARSTPGSATS